MPNHDDDQLLAQLAAEPIPEGPSDDLGFEIAAQVYARKLTRDIARLRELLARPRTPKLAAFLEVAHVEQSITELEEQVEALRRDGKGALLKIVAEARGLEAMR